MKVPYSKGGKSGEAELYVIGDCLALEVASVMHRIGPMIPSQWALLSESAGSVSRLAEIPDASPDKFVAVGRVIMRGAEFVARARSHTMALRIANALNVYVPNKKGF